MKGISWFLVLFLCISFLGFTVCSSAPVGRIQVEGADSILEKTLVSSESLKAATGDVAPRILVEYADSIFTQTLEKSSELETSASEVSPRILVEYADSVFTVSLKRPPLIGKLFSSLTISSLATSVSVNETFTVSGSISPPLAGITLTLTYTKPDETLLTRSVVTESDGSYADSFKPDQTGRWEVKAIWIGDDIYYGAESSLIYFEVTPIIFALTIQTPYKGILIEVNGEKYVTDANRKVEVEVSSDSNVVSIKVEYQVLEADFRAIFTGWSDAETSNQRTLTINRNTILIANYNLQYYIAVKTSPVGIVDVSGSGWYDAGSTVTIKTPPPLIGDKYEFRECIVNGESVGDKLPTIVMNKPYTITLVYYHVESLEILLPSGESTSATAATSSEIIRLIHTSSEKKFAISIREQLENGSLEYLMPQALLMAYNSSTENLMVRVNGEIVDFTVKPSGDDYLLTVTYASGQFQVDIYYVTNELIVNVKSWLLQQPIKDVSIQVLWSDETLFKSGVTDSRGMAKFDKLPSTNYIVKAEHQGQLFEWKGISLDQTQNLQLSFFVFDELLIFLVPAALVGVISPIILIPRRRLKEETERKIIQLSEKYRKESGGLTLLLRVYLDLGNLYLKNPKYVEKCVEKTLHRYEKEGVINGIKTYGRLKVVEFMTQLFTDDQRAALNLTAEAKGRITREEIAIHTNWDLNRIESILKEFELHGIARREIINGKQIWIFEGLKEVKPQQPQPPTPPPEPSLEEVEARRLEKKVMPKKGVEVPPPVEKMVKEERIEEKIMPQKRIEEEKPKEEIPEKAELSPEGTTVIIDGSSVAYHNSKGGKPFFKNTLLAYEYYKNQGYKEVTVICDAALRHNIDIGKSEFDSEVKKHKWLQLAPSNIKADLLILKRALRTTKCIIVTNDTYTGEEDIEAMRINQIPEDFAYENWDKFRRFDITDNEFVEIRQTRPPQKLTKKPQQPDDA